MEIVARKPNPVTFNPFDPPSEADTREARAQNLEERARIVAQIGDPIVQNFDRPSFRELLDEESSQRDRIAEHAAETIFGVRTRDLLTPRQANDLEGGAMYLVRRSEPCWLKAAREQAVETLLLSDEFHAVTRDKSAAERLLLAHRFAQAVRAAEIGVLENERSVSPATYLKIAASQTRSGAR